MDITLDKKDTTTASIKIKLKQEDYQPKVEAKLKEYSKKANIKGFRPGKVPQSLIKKMYGKDILIEEVLHLVSHSLEDYIKESQLQILGQPLPETEEVKNIDWANPNELEFSYSVGIVPEFQINTGLELPSYPIAVPDDLVNDTIERLRKQYGKYEEVEKSEAGDFIKGQLTKVDDTTFDEEVVLPINQVKEDLADKFVGLSKGDVVRFDIQNLLTGGVSGLKKLINLPAEEIEKLSGEFELTVTFMDRRGLAALDQEFFDKLFAPGEITSEEALKDKVKETLATNYQKETDYLLYKHIQTKLIDETPIELPKDFLKKWIAINKKEGEVEKAADIEEKDFENFLKQVKWDVIEDKLAKENKIEVAREEVIEKATQNFEHTLLNMGFSREMMQDIDKLVMKHLSENKGQNYAKYHGEVIFEKLMQVLKDQVKTTPQEISYDEFKKMATELNNA